MTIPPTESTTDWQPSTAITVLWTVLGFVLVYLGLALYAGILALRGGDGTIALGGREFLLSFIALIALFIIHEWLHGLAMRRYGAEPRYGAGVLHHFLPYFSCTAPGFRFTRGQFIVVSLTPAVVISVAGALILVLAGEPAEWLVLPLAIHLAGCIGDFWGTVLTLRQPATTRVEDRKTGIRFVHREPAATPPV